MGFLLIVTLQLGPLAGSATFLAEHLAILCHHISFDCFSSVLFLRFLLGFGDILRVVLKFGDNI